MAPEERAELAAGHGKFILFGEHAVVYGSRAIAAPVPLAVRARVVDDDEEDAGYQAMEVRIG